MKNKIKTGILFMILSAAALSTVPSFAVYENLSEEEAAGIYGIWTAIGVFALLVFAFIMYLLYRKTNNPAAEIKASGRKKDSAIINRANTKKVRNNILAIIGIIFAAKLILSVADLGYANDIGCFSYWGRISADNLIETYNTLGGSIDYPPGYVYILYITGFLGRLFNCYDSGLYTLIVKLPAMLCDCGIAWFIYLFAKDKLSKEWTYFFVVLWMLNPLGIIDSTIWGQVDAVLSLALVAGLYFITKDKYVLSSVVFGGAIMLKPQAIIVLPVLFYALLKNKKVKTFIFSFLAGVGTALVVALPFALNVNMETEHMQETVIPILSTLGADGGGVLTKILTPFAWIISLFLGTTGHYSYATVNALNFFFMAGANWKHDTEIFIGASYYIWGMAAIVVSALFVMIAYLKAKKSAHMPFFAGAVLLMLVANFGPRMHERYFFPAIVLLIIAAVLSNSKGITLMALASTALGYLSVLEILIDLNLGQPYMWPNLSVYRFILCFGNVALAVASAVYLGFEAFGNIRKYKFGKKLWMEI